MFNIFKSSRFITISIVLFVFLVTGSITAQAKNSHTQNFRGNYTGAQNILADIETATPTITNTPLPSCTGTDACKDSTATIGAGSCNNGQNGQLACLEAGGSIGDNACNGYQSCAMHTTGSIGNNSCNGSFSCTFTTINIGNNSCNGTSACFNETITDIGDCMYNVVQVAGCPTTTPTLTATATETSTPTLTATATETTTPTLTATATKTPTSTASKTITKTKTASPTKTLTPTKTPVTINLYSIAAQDGWVLESGENTNIGGTLNSTASTFSLGDDAAKRQYRGVLSFNTGGSIPDTATVTGVILKVKQQSILGTGNPASIFQGFLIDIKNGFFANMDTLQIYDFQAVASITLGPASPAPVGNVYNFNLVTGKAFINKLATNNGLTQIRLRFKLDDNNDALANVLNLYSGNAVNVADRPQLVITYTVP